MENNVHNLSEGAPSVLIVSLSVSLICGPIGLWLYSENVNKLRFCYLLVSFWFPWLIFLNSSTVLVNLLVNEVANHWWWSLGWILHATSAVCGTLGLAACYFWPKLGTPVIGLACGWTLINQATVFIQFSVYKAAIRLLFSILGPIVLHYRPHYLSRFLYWVTTQMVVDSIRLFTFSFISFVDQTAATMSPIETNYLNAGCLISVVLLFGASFMIKPVPTFGLVPPSDPEENRPTFVDK